MLKAFECYQTFNALKMHFTTNYDYIKYRGKVRSQEEKFNARKDRPLFVRLANKVKDKENLEDLIVSNVIAGNKKKWVQFYLTDEAWQVKERWKNNVSELFPIIEKELSYVCAISNGDIESSFESINGSHPLILALFYSDQISMETLICLDKANNIFEKWNTSLIDTIMWPDTYKLCVKYSPFLKKTDEELKNIVVKTIGVR